MHQQSEEKGAQHTSLRNPSVQCSSAGGVAADPYCLLSSCQETQQPVTQRGADAQQIQFVNEFLGNGRVEC